jgi:arylsulfatase A
VGRLLDTLDQLGVAEETVVIFLTDNGTDQHLYSKIRGQTLYGGKATLTDRGSQVPLLMRWPERIEAGSENAALVEAADFLPTLCEIAGAPLPDAPIHGRSFAETLSGADPAGGKEWVHIQKEEGRYLRTKEWIVTDTGVIKRVQPYPDDAVEVDRERLDASARETIDRMERALNDLTDGDARE